MAETKDKNPTPSVSGQRIRIRLKAYDHKLIDQSSKQIIETALRTGAKVAARTALPPPPSPSTVKIGPHLF